MHRFQARIPLNPTKRRWIATSLLCFLVATISLLSLLPETSKKALHTRGRFHYLAHLVVFVAAGFTAMRVSRSRWTRAFLSLGLLLFCIGIEFVQHIITAAAVEWADVLTDVIAVILGAAVPLLLKLNDGKPTNAQRQN